jgi:hypothetical protein
VEVGEPSPVRVQQEVQALLVQLEPPVKQPKAVADMIWLLTAQDILLCLLVPQNKDQQQQPMVICVSTPQSGV